MGVPSREIAGKELKLVTISLQMQYVLGDVFRDLLVILVTVNTMLRGGLRRS